MRKRKGELSSSAIDRDWPHQVALPQDFVGDHHRAILEFIRPLSAAPRTRWVTAVGPGHRTVTMHLYCFKDPADAIQFADQFGGVPFDPKRDRGRGAARDRWDRG